MKKLLVVLCLLSLSALHPRKTPAATPPNAPLRLGAAWYPEQWPEERWDADLTLMQQAHINVVRVGEFAWDSMEPSEGQYDFGWLDRAIAMAGKHGIAVVLGTPTAGPPVWLTKTYPDTLRVDEAGHRAEHGGRRQFSCTSPRYRVFAAGIAHQMATRYGHNPNVIGWQIDNEINADTFDPSAVEQWHAWLAHKYGTIAQLNRLWATVYWSQTYDSFAEVPFHSSKENPALLLDYKHFMTDTWTSYLQNQVDAIRPAADARQFITTNSTGGPNVSGFYYYDHYIAHRNLDLAAWDDYFPDGRPDMSQNAFLHDFIRGLKQKNFWVMETQPAFVDWAPTNVALLPGVTREMAWQAIGHGADAVLYWQWRSSPSGQEQYHGVLVGIDGRPVPVYSEIEKLGRDLELASPALAGTSPHNRVAVLHSYDSAWAIEFQRHAALFDYDTSLLDFYRAAQPVAQGIDVVSPDAELRGYAVVFAPSLNVIGEPLARRLLAYVEGGGHLVLGPRSGMKDLHNALSPQRQPGPLAAALGAHVEQFYALAPGEPPAAVEGTLGSGSASIWAEVLDVDAPSARVLLKYGAGDNGWFAGRAAVVENRVGNGTLTYIGASLDPKLMQAAVSRILSQAGVEPLLPHLPAGVELMQRSAAGRRPVWILINHTSTAQELTLPVPMHDHLAEHAGDSRNLVLPAHGIAVLTEAGF